MHSYNIYCICNKCTFLSYLKFYGLEWKMKMKGFICNLFFLVCNIFRFSSESIDNLNYQFIQLSTVILGKYFFLQFPINYHLNMQFKLKRK